MTRQTPNGAPSTLECDPPPGNVALRPLEGPARLDSPAVRRRQLGAELRRHREAAGLTLGDVAARLDCSASKISRLETGQTAANPRDVRDMLSLYRVGEAGFDTLVNLARQTRQWGWWRPYGSALTGLYVGLESAARLIRCYEVQYVPELLQTGEYAESLIRAAAPDTPPDEIGNRVRVRLDRQNLITQPGVELCCVLEEAALLRPIGGPDVMQRQLDYLRAVAERPNVTLRILPLDIGAHPGMDGSFVLLGFPDQANADTAYIATATGGVLNEKPDDVSRFAVVFDLLSEIALSHDASADLLARLAERQYA
jgi:hypothetical protein